jgi:IrrE N-terminal-like domain
VPGSASGTVYDRGVEQIEQLAERFLAGVPSYLWDGRTLPVPIEDIADSHVGLLVRDVEGLERAPGAPALADGQALSGLLLPDRGEIWVNASEAREWPPRRRFTIAHELGHWCLHLGAEHAVYCRASVIDSELRGERDSLPLPEEEANAFAAAVLMPAALIREQYAACDRDFDRLCRKFASSGAAMGRRLHAVI